MYQHILLRAWPQTRNSLLSLLTDIHKYLFHILIYSTYPTVNCSCDVTEAGILPSVVWIFYYTTVGGSCGQAATEVSEVISLILASVSKSGTYSRGKSMLQTYNSNSVMTYMLLNITDHITWDVLPHLSFLSCLIKHPTNPWWTSLETD